jgi:hypothetical protein
MPTDSFDDTFVADLTCQWSVSRHWSYALESLKVEGSHKQNYCHAIGQFVRNVFYKRFETEEEYFSEAKEEGEKLGKVLGDILADLFGEEYR